MVARLIPWTFAFSIAASVANFPTTWPNEWCPSTLRMPPLSATISGSASGLRIPVCMSSTYCGTRIKPCESWPVRLASAKWSPTVRPLVSDAPAATRIRVEISDICWLLSTGILSSLFISREPRARVLILFGELSSIGSGVRWTIPLARHPPDPGAVRETRNPWNA